jgi:hypothetical protein
MALPAIAITTVATIAATAAVTTVATITAAVAIATVATIAAVTRAITTAVTGSNTARGIRRPATKRIYSPELRNYR